MSPIKLQEIILKGIGENRELLFFHGVLLKLAESGGTRADARAVLENLRETVKTEADRDAVLDVLDIVEGFVSTHLRVW